MSDEGCAGSKLSVVKKRLKSALFKTGVLSLILVSTSSILCAQAYRSTAGQRKPTPPRQMRLHPADPLPGYTIMYISPYGSDSNDGTGWGRSKATIAGAYSALPTCSVPWPVSDHATVGMKNVKCGEIYLAPNGNGYSLASTLLISSTAVQIRGAGSQDTVVRCTALHCFEIFSPANNGAVSNYDGGLKRLSIIGNGSAEQVGVLNIDTSGTQFDDVHISGFTGRGASAITLRNSSLDDGINERVGGNNIFLENNNCGITYIGNPKTPSFGHEFWHGLDISLFNGQTGICIGPNVQIYSSEFDGVINGSNQAGATASAISIDSSSLARGEFNLPVDTGGAESISYCVGCSQSNFNGWGFMFSNSSNLVFQDTPVVIETTGLGAPTNSLSFYEGVPRSGMYLFSLFADGSNCLGTWNGSDEKFSVCPSTGALTVGPGSALTSTGAGGTMASIGANGISAGTITLLGGIGSHSFDVPYASPPVCTATDASRAAAVRITSTATAVSLIGADGDKVAWICTPAAN